MMEHRYETSFENMEITTSVEYKNYLKSLCLLASDYVPRIRLQFAAKAFEMYKNETVRKLVLQYLKEREELEASRLMDFRFASEHEVSEDYLEDTCTNNAGSYGAILKFLFEIA